jgi:aminoglycoside 3-N-acetyltransferase
MGEDKTAALWGDKDKAELLQQVSGAVSARVTNGPVCVHSDLFAASCFVQRTSNRRRQLQLHLDALNELCAGRALWFPCFNYEFTRSGYFDSRVAPCEVGPLGEFIRCAIAQWRTTDPVFSMCGTGGRPRDPVMRGRVVAFGPGSVFGQLYEYDATLLMWGAPLSSMTMLHLAESTAGPPIYRYDKVFTGTVVDQAGNETVIEYVYHVRPLGKRLRYDFPKLQSDLLGAGVTSMVEFGSQPVAQVCGARALIDYWVSRIHEDPFYLLDADSRSWVVPLYESRRRRFIRADFE